MVEAFREANARPWDNVTVFQRFDVAGEFPFSFTIEVPARDPQTAYRKIRDALAPGKVIRVQSN